MFLLGDGIVFASITIMGDDKTLDAAYGLKTLADNSQLYAGWAKTMLQ